MILRPGRLLGIPPGVPDVWTTVPTFRYGLLIIVLCWAILVLRRRPPAWLIGGCLFVVAATSYWVLVLGRPYGLFLEPDITLRAAEASIFRATGRTGILAAEGPSHLAPTLLPFPLVFYGPSFLPVLILPALGLLLQLLGRDRGRATLGALLWLVFSTGELDVVRGVGLLPNAWRQPAAALALVPLVALTLVESRVRGEGARWRVLLGVGVLVAFGSLVPRTPLPWGPDQAALSLLMDPGPWLVLGVFGLHRRPDPAAIRLVAAGAILSVLAAVPLGIDPLTGSVLYRLGLLLAAADPLASLLADIGGVIARRLPPAWGPLEPSRLGIAAFILLVVPTTYVAWWHPVDQDPLGREILSPVPGPLAEAMAWVRENTPRDAVFVAGPAFAPAVAVLGARPLLRVPDLVDAPNDARRRALEEKLVKGQEPERALARFRVTHVFIAPGDFREYGVGAPEELSTFPHLKLRYSNDEGYRVYEIQR